MSAYQLSPGFLGLFYSCEFDFPSPWRAWNGAKVCFLLFSRLPFYFSVLFNCLIASFVIPNALPLLLSLEYKFLFCYHDSSHSWSHMEFTSNLPFAACPRLYLWKVLFPMGSLRKPWSRWSHVLGIPNKELDRDTQIAKQNFGEKSVSESRKIHSQRKGGNGL
jgi:hypothetical protein